MILVDTSVWSLGLRRRFRDLNPKETSAYFHWQQLLKMGETCLIGPVRQEVLSGIVTQVQFDSLNQRLALVEELPLDSDTFILAATFYNLCRSKGIAPGDIDMMICAAAHTHNRPIFTTDPDFARYAKLLPIRFFRP